MVKFGSRYSYMNISKVRKYDYYGLVNTMSEGVLTHIFVAGLILYACMFKIL
jgi:hypothetical protein